VEGTLDAKADTRLPPPALAAASRVHARDVAQAVAWDGARLACGAEGGDAADAPPVAASLADAIGLPAILRAQGGLLADMDVVRDALYANG
jgi:hypothetical protein